MSTSAISNTLTVSNTLISKLVAASSANAQTMANYRLQLIGNLLTAQLNKKIATLQAQAQDPNIGLYQQQAQQLSQQQSAYSNAEAALSQNGTILSQISLKLSNLAVAVQAGDSASFDQTLATAKYGITLLQTVPFAAGLQPDGVASFQYKGFGIQSSATYDLSTAAGQAQALSDVQAAQAAVKASTSTTSLNQQVTASVQNALQTQIGGLSTKISNLQASELTAAAATINKLKQHTQTLYHLIQLNIGNETNAASVMNSVQALKNAETVPAGTTMSILVGNNGIPTLFSANLSTAASTSTSASKKSTGQIVSTSA